MRKAGIPRACLHLVLVLRGPRAPAGSEALPLPFPLPPPVCTWHFGGGRVLSPLLLLRRPPVACISNDPRPLGSQSRAVTGPPGVPQASRPEFSACIACMQALSSCALAADAALCCKGVHWTPCMPSGRLEGIGLGLWRPPHLHQAHLGAAPPAHSGRPYPLQVIKGQDHGGGYKVNKRKGAGQGLHV